MVYFDHTDSKWIGMGGRLGNYMDTPAIPAPFFRKTFVCEDPSGVKAAICGIGYSELYLNGKKVSDHVLEPIVSIYDRHVRYVEYDVAEYLKPGENCVGVILGNGWYNCQTPEVWNFVMASWRDYPKLRFELKKGGSVLLASGPDWQVSEGPIRFDALRNGEQYDAREEPGDWSSASFDASHWKNAVITAGPGGLLEKQTAPPCRVIETISLSNPNRRNVFDLGTNIAGHVRITVRGQRGTTVVIRYSERISEDDELNTYPQNSLVKKGAYQQDEYTLKGEGIEVWEPRFTYHGFRYVSIVSSEESMELLKAEARVVASSFESIGSFESSSEMLNTLQKLTRRSYLSNFVGIPTDCPHREKNGWTGDAQLACETGLFNFDPAEAYKQWLDTMRDCQRPNGDLPGIVPSSGWGYNWGNGPAWDSALFVIPYNIDLYNGDSSALDANYEAMKRYIGHCEMMSSDHIVQWGLGDWCSDPAPMVDAKLSSTACYYGCLKIFSHAASLFGKTDDLHYSNGIAAEVKAAFNRHYYKGSGIYAKGEMTAMATALYFDLCDKQEKPAVFHALVAEVEKHSCKAWFGILGAKYIPRVLSDHGRADLAYRIITQEEFPGWGNWVRRGAVSLWESWDGRNSRNHIMFGDISAWMYQYLAGFRHDIRTPGYRKLTIQPCIIDALSSVRAQYRGYVSEWERNEDGLFHLAVTVPDGCFANVILPDGSQTLCPAGHHALNSSCKSFS